MNVVRLNIILLCFVLSNCKQEDKYKEQNKNVSDTQVILKSESILEQKQKLDKAKDFVLKAKKINLNIFSGISTIERYYIFEGKKTPIHFKIEKTGKNSSNILIRTLSKNSNLRQKILLTVPVKPNDDELGWNYAGEIYKLSEYLKIPLNEVAEKYVNLSDSLLNTYRYLNLYKITSYDKNRTLFYIYPDTKDVIHYIYNSDSIRFYEEKYHLSKSERLGQGFYLKFKK